MGGRVTLGLAMLALAASSCTSVRSHIFIARPFESARDCVDPSEGIDVVDGPQPAGGCNPVCVLVAGDGGTGYYVSGMCPPYPLGDTVQTPDAGLDPTCTAALAAYLRNDTCNPDGGSTNPPEAGPADSGPTEAGDAPTE
jgi:hypothetical protein